jgi:hypothetical protein
VGGEGLRQDATATDATAAALADLEGECDPAWVQEEESRAEAVVVEQVVESHAVVDLGPVRRLREWAVRAAAKLREEEEMMEVPEWAPEWAQSLTFPFEDVVGVCDWFLGLKRRGPGEG